MQITRSKLIRVASTLPKGDPQRRAILAFLKQASAMPEKFEAGQSFTAPRKPMRVSGESYSLEPGFWYTIPGGSYRIIRATYLKNGKVNILEIKGRLQRFSDPDSGPVEDLGTDERIWNVGDLRAGVSKRWLRAMKASIWHFRQR